MLNGTTADANDVMDNFTEIYSDIDETNIGASNKTGSGDIVLQVSPTITSPAISGPTITGVTTLNSGADIRVYSDVATTLKFQVDGATGDCGIPSGRFLYLDGAGLSGNTHWSESSSDVAQLTVGGSGAVDANFNTTEIGIGAAFDLVIRGTKKLKLGGAGSDTSLRESSANTVVLELGGSDLVTFNSSGEVLLPSVDPPTANYGNRNGFVKGFFSARWSGAAWELDIDYNVSSISSTSSTEFVINWDRDFALGHHPTVVSTRNTAYTAHPFNTSAGSTTVTLTSGASGGDYVWGIAIGTQA